jgi:hypothetical protein
LKKNVLRNRFGSVHEISKEDWIKEVTEDSRTCWVVVLLYSGGVFECGLVEEAFVQLSSKFPYVKFLKIRSHSAIENWPDRNLPTLFVYKDGELQHQIFTLLTLGGSAMVPDGIR